MEMYFADESSRPRDVEQAVWLSAWRPLLARERVQRVIALVNPVSGTGEA